MSADKKVPEIRFKGFSGEWRKQCLGEIVTCFSGGTPLVSVNEYYKGNIPFIRSAEINKTVTELTISESGLKNSSAKLVELGTVLYALYGATSGEVGRARICGAINQAILAIVPTAKINPEFLVHWFRKNKGSIVNTYLQGGQGNLSGEIVKNLILNFTDFEEQSVIGSYIQKLDCLINQHQQKHDKLSNIKKAMLEKMFPKQGETVPEIRFKGFSGEWEETKLSKISDKIIEKNTSVIYSETFTNSAEFGIISQRNYFDKDISNSNNIGGYYVVQPEDFVYNPRISTFAPCGPINRNSLGRTGIMSPLYTVFRTNNVNTIFIEYFFKTKLWHAFMLLNGDTGARADRFSIKDSVFFELPLLLPAVKEQTAIGNYFQKLDALISQHQQQITKLNNIKQACLNKMFI